MHYGANSPLQAQPHGACHNAVWSDTCGSYSEPLDLEPGHIVSDIVGIGRTAGVAKAAEPLPGLCPAFRVGRGEVSADLVR